MPSKFPDEGFFALFDSLRERGEIEVDRVCDPVAELLRFQLGFRRG